jgi:hypothetical protein
VKRKTDWITIAGAVLVIVLVLFRPAAGPALMAFLASYGAATIVDTSAKKETDRCVGGWCDCIRDLRVEGGAAMNQWMLTAVIMET